MSYVLLIRALNPASVFIPIPDLHKPLFAITQSSNPKVGLELLNNYSPLKCELLHYIKADNRADLLARALHIRYKALLSHSFWYRLAYSDVSFIKSITAENFNNMPGLLRKPEPIAPPEPTPDELRASAQAALEQASSLAESLLA